MSVQPNKYTLKGGHITFVYFPAAPIDRRPAVTYTDPKGTKSFFGTGVRVENVGIGTLVTVTLEMTIDTGGTDFSVLIPDIELADAKSKQAFSTDGITTVFKGPDSIPRSPVQTYEFVHMTGTAEWVPLPETAAAKSA